MNFDPHALDDDPWAAPPQREQLANQLFAPTTTTNTDREPSVEAMVTDEAVLQPPQPPIWQDAPPAQTEVSTQDPSEEAADSTDLDDWMENIRKSYNPWSTTNTIEIEEIPEREGLLFKHTLYKVIRYTQLMGEDDPDPHADNSEDNYPKYVTRRYSDFVWLQEVLLKRYPFRLIPELPPKKIGSQNLNPIFLQKRRLSLIRFINLIIRHPILQKDDLLLTFLTVPADLSNWRKQTKDNYDTSDEFVDQKISISFMKLWKTDISNQWNKIANSINNIIECWYKIAKIIEKREKRLNQCNLENSLLSNLLDDFTNYTQILYPIENNNSNNITLPNINNNLNIINNHFKSLSDLNSNEQRDYKQNLYPKLKIFIDLLISLKNLFDRYKILATNNVPQLQRHIKLNMEKLESMKGKPDASGTEFDKIKSLIKNDKRSIMNQLNRAWLIRQCILHEFTLFQQSQFLISLVFKDWIQLNSNYTGLNLNEWEKLTNKISDMSISMDL